MRYRGKIENLNHIIISDPNYDENVTCRYERNELNEKNWLVDIDLKLSIEKFENFTAKGIEFFLFLCKDKNLGELKENGTISYLRGIKLEETDIGMDTACVALGINEKAEEIIDLRDDWQPECSLNTLTDGLFGTVKEGKIDDDVVFIWLSGYLDEDTDYSIDDIVDYLEFQLNITELEKVIEPISVGKETIQERIIGIEKNDKDKENSVDI